MKFIVIKELFLLKKKFIIKYEMPVHLPVIFVLSRQPMHKEFRENVDTLCSHLEQD